MSSTRTVLELQWFQDWHGGKMHSKGHVQPLEAYFHCERYGRNSNARLNFSPSEVDSLCVTA